jgi:predicted DNA-binding transcriptional regulator YafY
MSELLTKVKRQIEILAHALDNPDGLKPVDLAEYYGCEELTIKRDLQTLRAEGFDLHSERKRGIALSHPVDARRIKQLVIQYIGLANADTAVDRATTMMVKVLKERALVNIVRLQRCIESHHTAVILYRKEKLEEPRESEIQPHAIFQSEGYWRVLAVNAAIIKQYHLNKIIHVRPTERRFRPLPAEDLENMFRFSFRSWIGAEQHRITLALSPEWTSRMRNMELVETQVFTELPDGSSTLEATVNSLDEVASWVVSRGAGIKVLGPDALREKVIQISRGALANYD